MEKKREAYFVAFIHVDWVLPKALTMHFTKLKDKKTMEIYMHDCIEKKWLRLQIQTSSSM